MRSKVLMFLGVLLAVLLLVSSTEVAKETQPNEAENTQSKEVKEPEQQYGGRCRYGCCGGWGNYGCRRCCQEAQAVETEAYNKQAEEVKEPEQPYGGRCGYGCCGGWGQYGCRRCCRGAEEAQAFQTQGKNQQVDDQVKEPNQQSGGRCRYGCCGGWGRYGCQRCCATANEAVDAKVDEQGHM